MNWSQTLIELFNDPILAEVKPFAPKITSDDRLVEKFIEINEWVLANGGNPQEDSSDFNERKFFRRLMSFRSDEEKREFLLPYDTLKLLDL